MSPQLRLKCAQGGTGRYVYLISSVELRWQRPQLEIPLPPAINKNIISYNIRTKFNVYSDGTHTHPASGRVVRVKMR